MQQHPTIYPYASSVSKEKGQCQPWPSTPHDGKCQLLVIFDPILAQDAWHYSFQSFAEHKAAVIKCTPTGALAGHPGALRGHIRALLPLNIQALQTCYKPRSCALLFSHFPKHHTSMKTLNIFSKSWHPMPDFHCQFNC